MNIIERMRSILQAFPKISVVCNEIKIDFADKKPTSYGLSSIGDSLIFEDIIGNQRRKHSFILYSTFSGINDFERSENSAALTELSVWLSKQIGDEVTTKLDGVSHNGEITKISAGNGRLYEIEKNNKITGMRYQLQIEVEYTVNF